MALASRQCFAEHGQDARATAPAFPLSLRGTIPYNGAQKGRFYVQIDANDSSPVLAGLRHRLARAAGEGQGDLDKATDIKLNATTISDLSEVIRLSKSTLKKGLNKANTEFAEKLLSSTLVQRAQEATKQVLTGANSPAELREKRRFALADLEKAIKLNPKQPEAYLLMAR